MISAFVGSLASVMVVSLVSLIGVFTLSIKTDFLKKYIFILISLAVGALLGDALIHLIPESFEEIANPTHVSLAVIVGILVFFILEKFLHWHHHAHGEDGVETIHATGKMILVSDGVHNFIDGLIIGASFLVSPEVGIATTLAVILHEIPQEIGDFGVLIHAGYSRTKALWFNFLSALMSVVGVVATFLLSNFSEFLALWLVPVAAGGFIYIALSDLIPELHKSEHNVLHSVLQLSAVILGIGAMALLLVLE